MRRFAVALIRNQAGAPGYRADIGTIAADIRYSIEFRVRSIPSDRHSGVKPLCRLMRMRLIAYCHTAIRRDNRG
ncbi:MAG: hypothetical protein OJF60_000778 [Burkholderiaceae bacterium]|nr:MAG: hypothetical protein OJF60_000778 [Burkholderiaceae bacterium]